MTRSRTTATLAAPATPSRQLVCLRSAPGDCRWTRAWPGSSTSCGSAGLSRTATLQVSRATNRSTVRRADQDALPLRCQPDPCRPPMTA